MVTNTAVGTGLEKSIHHLGLLPVVKKARLKYKVLYSS